MGILWDRNIAVSFGVKGSLGTKITGLRIIFEIEKTSTSEPNTAKIAIYNLNKKNWTVLEDKKNNMAVILELGYKDEPLAILCSGDITKAAHAYYGPDTVTTIESGDGEKGMRDAIINKSYRAGTDEKTVIKDIINTIKDAGQIVVGSLANLKTEVSKNGLSISGSSKDLLDKLVRKQNLEWNIQDGLLQVLEPIGNTGEEAVLLTPSTGLVGSPIRREKGIEFKSLIQSTKLKPGRAVKIESRDITGAFRVRSAKYTGDTHGTDWYVTCEAQ